MIDGVASFVCYFVECDSGIDNRYKYFHLICIIECRPVGGRSPQEQLLTFLLTVSTRGRLYAKCFPVNLNERGKQGIH